MYCLDTNICIAIINNSNRQAVGRFYQLSSQCYLSAPVLAELYKGAFCSQKSESNLERINLFTELVEVVDFDKKAAKEFGKIQSELRKIGKPTGELDAIIASIVRYRQDILVTNNTRHFQNISDLNLENWL
jgi:tRNA(fMet)-specific endonuclease VapC